MNAWRIQRAAALCIGLTLVATPLLALPPMNGNAELTASWWIALGIVALVSAGAFLAVAGTERHRALLGPAVVTACAVELILLVLWFPARTGVHSAPDAINAVWVGVTATTVAIGLAVSQGLRASMVYTAVLLSLLTVVQSYAHDGRLLAAEVYRGAVNGALVGVFLAVAVAAMRIARKVDADRERVLAAAAAGAAATARAEERERLDDVVRDEVITVLRTVRAGAPARVQREQAHRALRALHGADTAERPDVMDAKAAYLRVRESLVAHGDHIEVILHIDDSAAVPGVVYPVDAIDALVDAAGEALINSLRHAGDEASQAVLGMFGDDAVRLRIVDDGRGFVPERIPPLSLGIEVGIRGRMMSVAEGSAVVESAPGEGTMVSLEWRRP